MSLRKSKDKVVQPIVEKENQATLNGVCALIKQVKSELTSEIADIKNIRNEKFQKIENDITVLQTHTIENTNKIDTNTDRINALENKVKEQDIKIYEYEESINTLNKGFDDMTNRCMRNTLIFRNIPRQEKEITWADTKNILADVITKVTGVNRFEVYRNLERAHRGKPSSSGNEGNEGNANNKPLVIVVKMVDWNFSEHVKNFFKKANLDKKHDICRPNALQGCAGENKKST